MFTANGINEELFVPFDGTLPHESDAIGWMLLPLRRYADFTGRSCRREYWMFTLLYAAFVFCLVFVGLMGGGDGSLAGLAFLILLLGSLGILVPAIAVQVRRLHDQDKSGWLALLNLIPWVGGIVC